jgi:hypothetical protein
MSDGKTLATRIETDGKPDTNSKPVADKFCEVLNGWLIRAGLFVGIDAADSQNPKDPAQIKLSGFKMLAIDIKSGKGREIQ